MNCYVAVTMVEGTGTDYCYTFSRANGQVNVINSYYLNPLGTIQGEQMSEEQFAGGEVCYLLNGDQSQCAWYQSLGQDRLPVLAPSHGVVTRNDDGTYGNITAVQEIAADQPSSEQDRIYNLMGQKVQRAQRGIFIIGGKKVYVK